MSSRIPPMVRSWMLLGMVAMSCGSYTEDIGGGFLVRTRVYQGMAHEYNEFDLYYRGILGIPRLIHSDVNGAEVSPDGEKVLFFARRHRPEPLGMDSVLYVFNLNAKELTKVEEGEFYHKYDYWSPVGDKFVYSESHEPIMLFDLSTLQSRSIVSNDFYFLGWSPLGQKIAYATDKSIYEVNSLHVIDVEELRGILVAEKEGGWKKEDFEWVTVDGVEKIVVKKSGR